MDEQIDAVQKMQDYIAAHLDTDISMADLARVSRYSPWYSYSPFVDLLHMTPAVYSRRLRLSKQIVIPERQTRRQPCCKFLSHIAYISASAGLRKPADVLFVFFVDGAAGLMLGKSLCQSGRLPALSGLPGIEDIHSA